jgi:hypothetical protein
MPLLPFQAQQLKDVGSQAGFGKGPESIVDRAVRDSIRMDDGSGTGVLHKIRME